MVILWDFCEIPSYACKFTKHPNLLAANLWDFILLHI